MKAGLVMRKPYLLVLFIAAFWLAACWPRAAAPTLVPTLPPTRPPSGQPITIADIVNVVETRASEAEVFVLAGLRQNIRAGAQLRTGDGSFAGINLSQGGKMRLAPKTLVTILDLPTTPDEPLARVRLSNGKIWMSLISGGVEVATPAGVAALRGPYAEFEYWPGSASDPTDDVMVVRCLKGVCGVQTPSGPLIVLGQMELLTLVSNGQPPSRAVLGLDALAEFVQNNPEIADLATTLTAGAPSETTTPTPTPTASASATTTPTSSVTATRTVTRTPTRTRTPGIFTATLTRTATAATPTVTGTPTRTRTPTISPTRSATLPATATRTWTATALSRTPTPTATATVPSRTPTPTAPATQTPTATVQFTSTQTHTSPPPVTNTQTETPTSPPVLTDTPTPPPPTATPTDTDTPVPSLTPTDTPSPTATT